MCEVRGWRRQQIVPKRQVCEHGRAFARPRLATIPHSPATPADDRPAESADENAVAEAWPLLAPVRVSPSVYPGLSATPQDAPSFLFGEAKDNLGSDGHLARTDVGDAVRAHSHSTSLADAPTLPLDAPSLSRHHQQ